MTGDVLADLADGARDDAGLAFMAGGIVLGTLAMLLVWLWALFNEPVTAVIIVAVFTVPYLTGKALVAVDNRRSTRR